LANPRIDDLRRKLEKEPGSRLFAQLAEELRKDGDLAEAIRVARQGLAQHPSYPSARMTLGRALLDSGALAEARREFETVLNGAPDNILASRHLAECLEGLGETELALHRYRATLSLAPGDKHVLARIEAMEKKASSGAPEPAAVQAAVEPAPQPPAEPEEPSPIRLVEVEGPMEIVSRFEAPPPSAWAPAEDVFFEQPGAAPAPASAGQEVSEAPVPLVPVDEEEFELERPYEAPPVSVAAFGSPAEPEIEAGEPVLEAEPIETMPEPVEAEPLVAEPLPEPGPAPEAPEPVMPEPDVIDEEFDLEPAPAPGPPRVTFREEILKATGLVLEDEPAAPPSAPAPPEEARPAGSAAAPEPELASPTLAELYYEQGVPEKAAEVYRRLLERDPGNDRLRARLREIESAGSGPAAARGGAPQDAIGRAIARLEDLRSALARKD
jgi:tetratricopeptide (TPR) repeat protein